MLDSLFQENKRAFQELINYMTDAIYVMEVVGGTFRYYIFNDAGMRHASIDSSAVGKTMEEVLPKGKLETIFKHYHQVLHIKGPVTFEYKDHVYAESILTPITDENDRITYILSVTRDITKRKIAEQMLQKSEQKYQSLFQNNTDAVYSLDLNGNVQSANKAGEILTEYTTNELLYKPFTNFVSRECMEKALSHFYQAKSGVTQEFEVRLRTKSGLEVDCVIKNIPMIVDQNIIGIFGICKDVTKEKRMVQSIRESEERFSNLLDFSPDANFIHVNSYIIYANIAAVNLVGATSSTQLIGKSIYDFYPFKSRGLVAQHIQQFDENNLGLVEEKLITIDGKEVDVEVSRIQTSYKGEIGIHSVVRDISKRKKLEKALKMSEERYRLITENSRDLIQLMDVDGNITYASPSHEKILGQSPDYFIEKKFSQFLTEERTSKFMRALKQAFVTKVDTSTEIQLLTAKSSWICLHLDFIPILDEEGRVENILLVGEDITERKTYEKKIHKMAFHDSLTGLPNRRYLNETIQQWLALERAKENKLAIVYLDCDNFKPINDKYGHDAGDEYLKELTQRLKKSVREIDVVSRFGGDEFVILLFDVAGKPAVMDVVNRIKNMTNLPWDYNGDSFRVTVSIGIALYPLHGNNSKELLTNADKALYQAKNNGKNTIQWYGED